MTSLQRPIGLIWPGLDDLATQHRDLMPQQAAISRLRDRRIGNALAATRVSAGPTLADRVRALWPTLLEEEMGLRRVLDQAIGLAMYDPARYAELGRQASRQYLPILRSLCPEDWFDQRKLEVSQMILATLRGCVTERVTTADLPGIAAGFEALIRALEREEAPGA